MSKKLSAYIWSVCGAGWAVIAYLTHLPEAAVTAVLCVGLAVIYAH